MKGEQIMQLNTERGLISVDAEFKSTEEAVNEGYCYSFTSQELNCDVYSKCLDDRGYRHTFALVGKLIQKNKL